MISNKVRGVDRYCWTCLLIPQWSWTDLCTTEPTAAFPTIWHQTVNMKYIVVLYIYISGRQKWICKAHLFTLPKKTEAWDQNWWKMVWEPLWSADSDLDLSWNECLNFKPQISLVQYLQINLTFILGLNLGPFKPWPKAFIMGMFMYVPSLWWKGF
jgi:hypothetical protein